MKIKFSSSFSVLIVSSTLVYAASTSEKRVNPKCNIYYTKGNGIPEEDGFFDPGSKDLENAYTNFIMNNHPSFKDFENSYKLSYYGFSLDSSVVDRKTLEMCAAIDSDWSSGALDLETLRPSLEAFWKHAGVFDYIKYDENYEDWIPTTLKMEPIESDVENGENEKDNKKKLPKNMKKSSSSKRNKKNRKQKSAKLISAIMSPKMELVRFTLENNFCQRAMIPALSILSPVQVATLFRNAPAAILDNPEIIGSIQDFSEFKDSASVTKLNEIMGNRFLKISENMVRTLPMKSLHKLLEARNFDLSRNELMIMMTAKPELGFEEPFSTDHRIFRVFCADNASSPVPNSVSILKAIEDSGLTCEVVESVLAYYVRSELAVSFIVNYLRMTKAFGRDNAHLIDQSSHEHSTGPPLNDLLNIFRDRNQLGSVIEPLDPVLFTLLKTPTSGYIRNALINNQAGSNVDSLEAFWNDLVPGLSEPIPYQVNSTISLASQVYGLWKEATLVVSEKFISGRWTRNILQLLVLSVCPENGVESEEFFVEAKEVLRLHPSPHRPYPNISFQPYDWIIQPIRTIMIQCSNADDLSAKERLALGYKSSREFRKILSNVDLGTEGVIEALWKSVEFMTTLLIFPYILNQGQVDALVSSEIGQELLKANPSLLQRLPSYANFTVEDMNRLNLTLDDLALSIGTLNVETGHSWFIQQEGLVNSASRTLLRPHQSVTSGKSTSWPLITFDSLRSDPSFIKDLNNVESIVKFHELLEEASSLNEKLSLIARWLVHLDTQSTWLWLLCWLPDFNSEIMDIRRETTILCSMEFSQTPKIISHLAKIKTTEDRETIENLISILNERHISTVKMNLMLSNKDIYAAVKPSKEQARELLKSDNDFIIKLIQNGPGSSKFKRVWSHRAKLLIMTDIDMKTVVPFEGMEAADLGLIPLDDALLQWFLLNRIPIERLRIMASIRRSQGLEIEPVLPDVPYSEWYNLIIR